MTVSVAQIVQANIQLKTGASTETVYVNTAPPLMQTQEASVGQVIGSREVNNLPLNGRNFTFLAQLGAGMQTPQADTRGNAASGAFSANGLRPAQNNYLLDGIDNNSNAVDFLNGTNYVILPPVDAIQEFKVQTADFSAELGRAGGAVLNATIKSGTNQIHGAVWEFFRNDKLDSADYFENNTGIKKGELRQNQFGGDIGGPIIRNKVFFFGDYEGFRRVQGTAQNGNVPTALERSSGFSNLSQILGFNDGTTRTDALGRAIQKGTILDPATTRFVASGAVDPVSGLVNSSGSDAYVRDPFGTSCAPSAKNFTAASCPDLNHIPSARLDPNAVKLLQLYPTPNSGTQVYGVSPNLYEHRNQFDIRGDVNPSASDQAFVRFSYSDDPIYIPGIFGGIADGGGFQQGAQTAKSDQAVAGYTHVFTPKTINQVRAGFAHLHTTRLRTGGSRQRHSRAVWDFGYSPGAGEWRFTGLRHHEPANPRKQFLPAFRRSQPDSPGDGRLHEDLWQPQLQDGDRVPVCEILDAAAGVGTRPVRLQRHLCGYSKPGKYHRRNRAVAGPADSRSGDDQRQSESERLRLFGRNRRGIRLQHQQNLRPEDVLRLPTSRMTGRYRRG